MTEAAAVIRLSVGFGGMGRKSDQISEVCCVTLNPIGSILA
jgi:hypothetical protein